MPETADRQERHFDALGQALGGIALGGLAFAAIQADRTVIMALIALVIAILAFLLFIKVETERGAAALVPLAMFRSRGFLGAMTATTGMTFGMYGVLFLLPLAWQSSGILDLLNIGLALIPMALVFVLVSPFSGVLSHKLGNRSIISGGVAVIGFGLLIISASAGEKSIWIAEVGLALTGLGMGLATGPLLAVAVGAVPVARSGTPAALINVARMAGATIGVAVLGAVFAAAHDITTGLRLAMLLGGMVQLTGAAVAWTTTSTLSKAASE